MEDGLVNNKLGFIIQARMKSTRLPGKVLMSLPLGSDKTILDWIVDELSLLSGEVVIATSKESSNNQIQEFCFRKEVECFRGSENDVLSRFIDIQKKYSFEYIVRLTADNPFIDGKIIKKTTDYIQEKKCDYVYTSGLPLGMNIEVFKGESLIKSMEYVNSNKEREHVTVVLRENSIFQSEILDFVDDNKNLRVTIDTVEDMLVANSIASISKYNSKAGMELIREVYNYHSWVFEGNKNIYQKKIFHSIYDEFKEAIILLKNNEFYNIVEFLNNNEISK